MHDGEFFAYHEVYPSSDWELGIVKPFSLTKISLATIILPIITDFAYTRFELHSSQYRAVGIRKAHNPELGLAPIEHVSRLEIFHLIFSNSDPTNSRFCKLPSGSLPSPTCSSYLYQARPFPSPGGCLCCQAPGVYVY